RLQRGIDRSKESEGRSSVADVSDVEEPIDHGARLMHFEMARDDSLAPLIEDEHRQRQEQIRPAIQRALSNPPPGGSGRPRGPPAQGVRHALSLSGGGPSSARACRQRLQSPSVSASGVTFQQRSHRRPEALRKRIFSSGYAATPRQPLPELAASSVACDTMNKSAKPVSRVPVASRSRSSAASDVRSI